MSDYSPLPHLLPSPLLSAQRCLPPRQRFPRLCDASTDLHRSPLRQPLPLASCRQLAREASLPAREPEPGPAERACDSSAAPNRRTATERARQTRCPLSPLHAQQHASESSAAFAPAAESRRRLRPTRAMRTHGRAAARERVERGGRETRRTRHRLHTMRQQRTRFLALFNIVICICVLTLLII